MYVYRYIYIWAFPKIGEPANHPFVDGISHVYIYTHTDLQRAGRAGVTHLSPRWRTSSCRRPSFPAPNLEAGHGKRWDVAGEATGDKNGQYPLKIGAYWWIYVDICGCMWILVHIGEYMWIYMDNCPLVLILIDIDHSELVNIGGRTGIDDLMKFQAISSLGWWIANHFFSLRKHLSLG